MWTLSKLLFLGVKRKGTVNEPDNVHYYCPLQNMNTKLNGSKLNKELALLNQNRQFGENILMTTFVFTSK